jgi:hypothetical protein
VGEGKSSQLLHPAAMQCSGSGSGSGGGGGFLSGWAADRRALASSGKMTEEASERGKTMFCCWLVKERYLSRSSISTGGNRRSLE